MKFIGLLESRRVSFAFLGENVQQNRLFLRFQKLKCPDEERDIVSIDRPVVTQSEFLKDDAGHQQALDAFLNFMRELRH